VPQPDDSAIDLAPFELLTETADQPVYDLPTRLRDVYAGAIGFESPCVYANFVSSVDGVVTLGPEQSSPGSLISGNSRADRFVMGLLRACADTVLLGAGTLRDSPGHRWTPAHVFPDAAAEFAELRRRLKRTESPRLVVVTAGGDIDVLHSGLVPGSVIVTSDVGARHLMHRLPAGVEVRSLGEPPNLSVQRVVESLRGDGDGVILTEGGPTLVGQLLRGHLVNELFLTLSPVLLGRSSSEPRPGLVDATAFAVASAPALSLSSARRHGSHLFLRYAVEGTRWPASPPSAVPPEAAPVAR
jgi:riboflavin biosynthesis pyrimidine reductase